MRNVILLFLIVGNINCKTHHWNTYLNKKNRGWWDQRKETTAKVVDYFDYYEPFLLYSYVVDSKKYTAWLDGFPFDNFCIGMKYYVAYNPNDPSQSQLQIWKPILDNQDSIEITEGTVRRAWFSRYYYDLKSSFLYVAYEFNYKESKKREWHYQAFIYDSTIKPHRNLMNKKFKVKYWKENVNRSIIDLKEEIK